MHQQVIEGLQLVAASIVVDRASFCERFKRKDGEQVLMGLEAHGLVNVEGGRYGLSQAGIRALEDKGEGREEGSGDD